MVFILKIVSELVCNTKHLSWFQVFYAVPKVLVDEIGYVERCTCVGWMHKKKRKRIFSQAVMALLITSLDRSIMMIFSFRWMQATSLMAISLGWATVCGSSISLFVNDVCVARYLLDSLAGLSATLITEWRCAMHSCIVAVDPCILVVCQECTGAGNGW